MTDYISREAAIEAFEGGNQSKYYPFEVRNRLRDLPAADVRPVVKAQWTDHRTLEHDGEWWCTACGNEVTICMCGKDKTWTYNFCPNCGADMRGTDDAS